MNLKFWTWTRWTQFQVEKVLVTSTGFLCQIRSKSTGGLLTFFFRREDIKNIHYQPGQGLRRTLTIKKRALRRRGLL